MTAIKKSALKEAIVDWQRLQPEMGRTCCFRDHLTSMGNELPDDSVCDRERAWRKYKRIRDTYISLGGIPETYNPEKSWFS